MHTCSSETPIGWKSGKTSFVPYGTELRECGYDYVWTLWKGVEEGGVTPPPLSPPYLPGDLRINSFKDDVTVFLLLGVFFMLEPQETNVPL
jgi:hypothetical protein